MTFGEKLRSARKEAGLSQEQLAEKLCVSRSAVAKWESGGGLPDVSSLRLISQLLGVSIDYILSEDDRITFNEVKEAIDLEYYEKTGNCRDKKDAVCCSKFQDAEAIYPLIRRKKLSIKEFVIDLVTQWGVSQLVDYAGNTDGYYLVERNGKQYLVRISKEFIITCDLPGKVDPKRFVVGNSVFTRSTYRLV